MSSKGHEFDPFHTHCYTVVAVPLCKSECLTCPVLMGPLESFRYKYLDMNYTQFLEKEEYIKRRTLAIVEIKFGK